MAIREALRLGTRDARLFYHAGMIALAARDKAAARSYLERALALSPQFDLMQAFERQKSDGGSIGAIRAEKLEIAEYGNFNESQRQGVESDLCRLTGLS